MDEEHSRFDHVRASLAVNRHVYAHRYFRLRLPLRPWVTQKFGFRTRSLRRCRYSLYGETKTNRQSARAVTQAYHHKKFANQLLSSRILEVGGYQPPKKSRRQPQTD
jgi:hypothetical protein